MSIKYDANGLVPAITQDRITGEVLMLAYMNDEAYKKTVETGIAHYFSRSRNEIWKKGETSGHYQQVESISYDCDCDALLLSVIQTGAACHTGNKSCFYRAFQGKPASGGMLRALESVVKDRRDNPKDGSYTNYLFDKGIDKILKKVGEETAEVIIAAKNEGQNELVNEAADLIYHLTVLFNEKNIAWDDVLTELHRRYKD